jgi:ATP-binding cassette subfamily F protein 3
MQMVQLNDVSVNYAGREIFRSLSWTISERDRVGLVGPNGSGKSSLLKLIAGVSLPDQGVVTRMRGLSVGYLPQQVDLTPGCRLIDEAMRLPPELERVESALNAVEARLASPEVFNDAERLANALAEQDTLIVRYQALGGPQHASKVRELLAHVGFTAADHELTTDALSGGQKKLIALVKLAAENPDLLLLDEPDNHLDLQAKHRLESFIRAYTGAVVIVSHDRYLLDDVADQIAELAEGKLTIYAGNYSAYVAERELRRLRQQQMFIAQQKRISQIEAAIARFELWASMVVDERHIRQARSRRKMLERMEARGEIIEQVTEARRLSLKLDGWRGSTKALEARKLAAAFDDDYLFTDLEFLIRHGERIGLVGPNGAGKSVLFRMLLGELAPFEGEVRVGPSTRIGYYAQEHQTLAEWWQRTPIDFIRDVSPSDEGPAVALLNKFLFTYEQTRQPIRSLSGGERSRLQLAALMLQKPNLLLLDEPTNNLDIPSSEALENALEDFDGAVFVISHDRYFLDRVVDRVFVLNDGTLRVFEGGYTDYLAALP